MMSEIDTKATVGEVAVKHPEAKLVFEKLGIDYCCGGAAALEVAAEKSGHSVREVVSEIEKAIGAGEESPEDRKDWSEARAKDLAEHILGTHHVFMKSQLPRLTDLFEKVIAAHGEKHGEMLRSVREVFFDLKAEIEAHLMKEEQILFPYILALDDYVTQGGARPVSHCGTVRNPIRQMEHEHENAGRALEWMRELTSDYALPEDACASFEALYEGLKQMEADLHEHIHLENNVLFPKSEALEDKALGEG